MTYDINIMVINDMLIIMMIIITNVTIRNSSIIVLIMIAQVIVTLIQTDTQDVYCLGPIVHRPGETHTKNNFKSGTCNISKNFLQKSKLVIAVQKLQCPRMVSDFTIYPSTHSTTKRQEKQAIDIGYRI